MDMNDFLKRCEQKGYDNTLLRHYRKMMKDIEMESIYGEKK
jgi:hypothetical protein